MKDVYDRLTASGVVTPSLEAWGESQFFKNLIYKLHNDIVTVIGANMLYAEGNINVYSLGNEIAQVDIELSYEFV